MRRVASCISALLLAVAGLAQPWPQTRAERTNYLETSHYADVVQFLRGLQMAGAPVSVQMIGKSTEGREIPLAIASIPPVASPAEARRLGKPIVYVQANIHAGEVEGKEAILHVLRRLSQHGATGVLSKIVLLVVPIYNIDGNEKFGPVERNRPGQDGPLQTGVRANGQGLDLNRDSIKNESPENQALLRHVYNTWDPDVMMDLHTTNGTRHGWDLTYSPPLNPNTEPGVMKLSRDVLIPHLRREMARAKMAAFDYGNTETRDGKQAWYTFGQEGRYCTNYAGLRNRIAILSEAATYLPFRDRVAATDVFVTKTLEWVAANARRVVDSTRAADAHVVGMAAAAPQLGVRFEMASRGEEAVLLEKRPAEGASRPSGRPKDVVPVRMPVFDRFRATRLAALPMAYIIPASEQKTIDLLRSHGIVVERLVDAWRGPVQEFVVSELKQAERPFQGHRLITLEGSFRPAVANAAAGAYVVRTAQPLGILAFHILEPESQDGAAAWEVMGSGFQPGQVFPIVKTMVKLTAPTERL